MKDCGGDTRDLKLVRTMIRFRLRAWFPLTLLVSLACLVWHTPRDRVNACRTIEGTGGEVSFGGAWDVLPVWIPILCGKPVVGVQFSSELLSANELHRLAAALPEQSNHLIPPQPTIISFMDESDF
jgi:hypothetical protein